MTYFSLILHIKFNHQYKLDTGLRMVTLATLLRIDTNDVAIVCVVNKRSQPLLTNFMVRALDLVIVIGSTMKVF